MKIKNMIHAACVLAFAGTLAGCEGEKDLIIIEGNLPIKTSTLYMVGDATPNGWSIDFPTPLEAGEEDPLVFSWEGALNKGEMKLCLTTGSWDAGFIRPMFHGAEIGREPINDAEFQMHAGDPDEKWYIAEAGSYRLTFNLRNWTMSTAFLGGQEAPDVEPIETETLFMIGDATPNGWSMDNATAFTVSTDNKYIFTWEGDLVVGNMKACTEQDGTFSCPFIRPSSANVEISSRGVAASDFVFTKNPDDQWHVTEAGKYRITFDLEHWTIDVQSLGGTVNPGDDKEPLETKTLYMIGDATPNGWSMDNPTAFTLSDAEGLVFTWEGSLVSGEMKACLEPDPTFSCPFLRPTSDGCGIDDSGVASPDFVYTTGPDNKWRVKKAGRYLITFNLKKWTVEAKYLD